MYITVQSLKLPYRTCVSYVLNIFCVFRCERSLVYHKCETSLVFLTFEMSLAFLRCKTFLVFIKGETSLAFLRGEMSSVFLRGETSLVFLRGETSLVFLTCEMSLVFLRCNSKLVYFYFANTKATTSWFFYVHSIEWLLPVKLVQLSQGMNFYFYSNSSWNISRVGIEVVRSPS